MCHITDHALLRYLERVKGIDVQAARLEMMAAENAVHTAASMGCDTVKLGNGARLKLHGDIVSTVLPKRGY
jgi:hypothetical protein